MPIEGLSIHQRGMLERKDGGRGVLGRKSGCLAICEEKESEEQKKKKKIGMQSHLQLKSERRAGRDADTFRRGAVKLIF